MVPRQASSKGGTYLKYSINPAKKMKGNFIYRSGRQLIEKVL
jgi:hypothetical protein